MPAIQSLKKQLRGIRSTQKLTKAMKTVSTIKFTKLNSLYSHYSEYGRQCEKMAQQYSAGFSRTLSEADKYAPTAVIVLSSNKGLCGNFNTDLLNLATEEISKQKNCLIIPCGKKAVDYFKVRSIPVEKEYILGDIPSFEECSDIIDEITLWRKQGKVSKVLVVYSEYTNIMKQKPAVLELFSAAIGKNGDSAENIMFVPDRVSVVDNAAKTVLRGTFYETVLESALGAQAATLTTMRSAYDTATEYCLQLESQINRIRQNAVTADVIETSTEWRE